MYKTPCVAVAFILSALAPSFTVGQTLVTDTFSRNVGNPGDSGADPPVLGLSDWGSTEGGAAGPQPYRVVTDLSGALQEYVDGSAARLNFGRTLLDYNIAAAPGITTAEAVQITVDINPGDTGDVPFNGRDWAGILLSDSNSLVAIGGSPALFSSGNQDSRVGAGPRNSGTMIVRQGPANIRATGIPGSLNEPIFDNATWNDYQNWYAGGDGTDFGDPVNAFENDSSYTFRMEIRKSGATTELFESDGEHEVTYSIKLPGEATFSEINTGLPSSTFFWGDNEQTAGGAAGDYNQDGTVDAADYTLWRDNEGRSQADDPSFTLPNDPFRGVIDDRQFEQWATNYQITSVIEGENTDYDPTPGVNDAYLVFVGNAFDHQFDNLEIALIPGAATLSVPEPSACLLVAMALLSWSPRRAVAVVRQLG